MMCERKGSKGFEVLILGASGFIGSRLEAHLAGRGLCVKGTSSKSCNLLELDQVRKVFQHLEMGTRLVFLSTINKDVENSYRALLCNLEMVKNLGQSVPRDTLGGIIFMSSVDVYGPAPQVPITEKTMPVPTSFYAISKLTSEYLLKIPEVLDCPLTVLRLPGVYGQGDQGRSIVGKLINLMITKSHIPLFGGGKVLRDYVEVEDVCSIVESLINDPYDGLLNVATGTSLSILEIIETIAKEGNFSPKCERLPEQDGSVGDLVFDVSAFRSTFPKLKMKSLGEGVRLYLRSF